ncbi:Coiled-coil domain-containing protein 19, mitochondrial, partial [Operophtera brumata]
MPKIYPTAHDGIKYHNVRKGSDPGCYQLHRPSVCRLKFPISKRPIHKCEIPKHDIYMVPQIGGWRELLVPKVETNYYPAVMHKDDYDRLKKQAKIQTQEEMLEAMHSQEAAIQLAAKESEDRKRHLKESLLPQPGAAGDSATGTADPELEGPDQAAHTLLDAVMEENRQSAVKRAEADEERRHGLRLQNLTALKEQLHAHEFAK